MESRTVIDDGKRYPKGTRVTFVPLSPDAFAQGSPGAEKVQMIPDDTSSFILQATTSTRTGGQIDLLRVDVSLEEPSTSAP
jgi:hypothetical protein